MAGARTRHRTQSALDAFAVTARDNAAAAALNGPPTAIATLGGRVSFEIFVTAAVAAALVSILLVTRHTRAEEQAGRTELVRSAPVGALAQPAAALLLVLLASTAPATRLAVRGDSVSCPTSSETEPGSPRPPEGSRSAVTSAARSSQPERARPMPQPRWRPRWGWPSGSTAA